MNYKKRNNIWDKQKDGENSFRRNIIMKSTRERIIPTVLKQVLSLEFTKDMDEEQFKRHISERELRLT